MPPETSIDLAESAVPGAQLTALVSGANRGLGRGIAEGLANRGVQVYAGFRAEPATAPHAGVVPLQLDVLDDASVGRAMHEILADHGHLDIVVNNAGIYLDDPRPSARFRTSADYDPKLFLQTVDMNVNGAARLITAALPSMVRQRFGRIVNVSSGRGRMSDLDTAGLAYRLSKLALNGLTVAVAREVAAYDILVNAVCPGWVRTAMGGEDATRDVHSAARNVVWAALLPRGGPSGMLLRDRGVLEDLTAGR